MLPAGYGDHQTSTLPSVTRVKVPLTVIVANVLAGPIAEVSASSALHRMLCLESAQVDARQAERKKLVDEAPGFLDR